MSIREKIRDKPAVSVAFALAVIGVASVFIGRSTFSGPERASSNAYYTTDDGRTTFVDSLSRIPPFDHDGKPASRVWMFTCDGGKTRFVGYLERCSAEARVRLNAAADAAKAKPNTGGAGPYGGVAIGPGDLEVKKPGEGNPWVGRLNLAEASKVTRVTCPQGGSGDLEVLMP